MSELPRVSVLMPAYNAEKYIGEAIESILNQTFNDFEFIIIDDCSTDRTWEIIQQYAKKDGRILSLQNDKNLKLSATLNRGIGLAKGKYIARMDADDWSYPDRLKKQVDFMEEHLEIGISGGTMEVCDVNLVTQGYRQYDLTDAVIRRNIFKYSPFSHPLIILRADVFKEDVFGSRIEYNLGFVEDYELYFRIGNLSQFGNLKDVLLKYRVVGTGISESKARRQEQLTLYVRLKAVFEFGYQMRCVDKLYFLCQLLSMYIISQKIKIKMFRFFRDNKNV